MHNDRSILIFFVGLISLQLIVKLLKRHIEEDRPVPTKTHGMPSTRSAVIFYIITYLILSHKLKDTTKLILVMGGVITSYVKYYADEHTIKQLLIGGLIGIMYAYLISHI